jgi:hypothetical protein
MALTVQLVNDLVGSLVIDHGDPIDINDVTQVIKRSEDYDGVIYQIILDFEFIKRGRRFLKECYETAGGIDAEVLVNVYSYNPNLRKHELYFNGRINFSRYELTETTVVVNIEQIGMEMRIGNFMESVINLETEVSENGTALPPQNTIDVEWHSKTLLKASNRATDEDEVEKDDAFTVIIPNAFPLPLEKTGGIVLHCQVDNSKVILNDLEQTFDTPSGWIAYDNPSFDQQIPGSGTEEKYVTFLSAELRKAVRNHMYQADEPGTLSINAPLRLKHSILARNEGGDVDVNGGPGVLGFIEIWAWFEHRDIDNNIITLESFGQWNTDHGTVNPYVGEFEEKVLEKEGIVVNPGDKFYIYVTYRVWGTYVGPTSPVGPDGLVIHDLTMEIDNTNTHFIFQNRTASAPSLVRTTLIYEAIQRCCQYITNQVDCFKSDLLGRLDLGYAADGKGALIGLTNGNRLRLNSDRPLFSTLKDLLDFVNSLYCIGFGFETIDGVRKLVLEERSYFYNKNLMALSLGKVYDVRKKLDPKRFNKQVEYGYTTKLDIKQVNGVDEFCTIRRNDIPIINSKNQLRIGTNMITGGFQIETQRRLAESTEDSKLDDSNFASVLIRDGEGFRTKRDEGYVSITGVFDPASGYNYDISPRRNIENWKPWLSAQLIRSFNKTLKFTYGEVNFVMATQKVGEPAPLAENSDIDMSDAVPYIDNEIYTIDNVRLTSAMVKQLQANKYGYVEFEDAFGNKMKGFIPPETGISHNENQRLGDFNLLKVYEPI